MRIAIAGPFGFHPNKTMRSRALPLARCLVAAGHQVRLVMPPWHTPVEAGRRWWEDGVEIINVKLTGGILLTVGRMLREIVEFRPDAVHAFKPKAYSGLVQWALWQQRLLRRQSSRLPLLVTDTDDWEGWGGWNEIAPYSKIQKHVFAWQEQWGLIHCDRLTVASLELRRLAIAHGTRPEQIVYLPNGPGIPPELPPLEVIHRRRLALGLDGRPVLLLYSRLFEFDPARLVRILAIVRSAVPDLAVLSIGTGLYERDQQALRERFRAEGLLDAVVDLGWLEESLLPEHLLAADLALYLMDDTLLNRTKCPVKLADMISLGLPVVGEAVGQVPEYVHHEQNGLLYASGDHAAVARGIISLLQNPARRDQFGRQGRLHSRELFDWNQLARQLEQVVLAEVEKRQFGTGDPGRGRLNSGPGSE